MKHIRTNTVREMEHGLDIEGMQYITRYKYLVIIIYH
jgi:hypothetical protein